MLKQLQIILFVWEAVFLMLSIMSSKKYEFYFVVFLPDRDHLGWTEKKTEAVLEENNFQH